MIKGQPFPPHHSNFIRFSSKTPGIFPWISSNIPFLCHEEFLLSQGSREQNQKSERKPNRGKGSSSPESIPESCCLPTERTQGIFILSSFFFFSSACPEETREGFEKSQTFSIFLKLRSGSWGGHSVAPFLCCSCIFGWLQLPWNGPGSDPVLFFWFPSSSGHVPQQLYPWIWGAGGKLGQVS